MISKLFRRIARSCILVPAIALIACTQNEPVASVSLNKSSMELEIGESESLSATILPSNASFKTPIWTSSDPSVASVKDGLVSAIAEGSATITAEAGDKAATCTVTVTDSKSAVPEMVDLHLPSGLKWASFNLEASKPEEYGGCYQWAGKEDVTDTGIYLDWDNCPYHTGISYLSGWTKYIPSDKSSMWSGSGSPDNKTTLDPEDDIARVKLGGKWRVPTENDWIELINNCDSEWATLNGVDGRWFISRENGNRIFLPAAGYRIYDFLYDAGFSGRYLSSSIDADYPTSVFDLSFGPVLYYRSSYHRCSGMSVRPVSE